MYVIATHRDEQLQTNSIFIVFYCAVAGINIVNYFSAMNTDIPNITPWTVRS